MEVLEGVLHHRRPLVQPGVLVELLATHVEGDAFLLVYRLHAPVVKQAVGRGEPDWLRYPCQGPTPKRHGARVLLGGRGDHLAVRTELLGGKLQRHAVLLHRLKNDFAKLTESPAELQGLALLSHGCQNDLFVNGISRRKLQGHAALAHSSHDNLAVCPQDHGRGTQGDAVLANGFEDHLLVRTQGLVCVAQCEPVLLDGL
mmetsp:Transcript_4178/g.9586  ORF Transcript_4178/g.9586 Transcript_4178/m.9586 type:complete len:201 (-) Transcript_4178:670-1272(-)